MSNLRHRCISDRRRRKDLDSQEQGCTRRIHAGQVSRGRPMRSPYGDAFVEDGRPPLAESLRRLPLGEFGRRMERRLRRTPLLVRIATGGPPARWRHYFCVPGGVRSESYVARWHPAHLPKPRPRQLLANSYRWPPANAGLPARLASRDGYRHV